MNFPPDLIEERVSNVDRAWELLNNKLPHFKNIYSSWLKWYKEITSDTPMQKVIADAVLITYARMAMRNGSLSISPRSYHCEKHIDDLLYRLMSISQLADSKTVPDYGWSLLSLFMSGHDLRQSEKKNMFGLIGYNEQASYQELSRLLTQIDKDKVVRQEHKELLKLMIHGSTFGEETGATGNIYQGNLVKYILRNVGYFANTDKELAYLACDVDTANVATDLKTYAQSSIDVYNEIQNVSKERLSAQVFFGQQQEQYFFNLQKFNSKLGVLAFAQRKRDNAPRIKQVCDLIKQLDENMQDKDIVKYYQSHMGLQS